MNKHFLKLRYGVTNSAVLVPVDNIIYIETTPTESTKLTLKNGSSHPVEKIVNETVEEISTLLSAFIDAKIVEKAYKEEN